MISLHSIPMFSSSFRCTALQLEVREDECQWRLRENHASRKYPNNVLEGLRRTWKVSWHPSPHTELLNVYHLNFSSLQLLSFDLSSGLRVKDLGQWSAEINTLIEDYCLLRREAVKPGRCLLAFYSTRLHEVTFRKTQGLLTLSIGSIRAGFYLTTECSLWNVVRNNNYDFILLICIAIAV